MKILLFFIASGIFANPISKNCIFKGIKLQGRGKVVLENTIKVRVVHTGEDLRVNSGYIKKFTFGSWRFVGNNEDFRIRYVGSSEDIKIRFIHQCAGIP